MMVLHQGSGSPRRGHGALPLARDLAVSQPRPPARRAHAADGGLRRGAAQLPGRRARAQHAPAAPSRAARRSTRSGPPAGRGRRAARPVPASRSTTRSRSSTPPSPSASCSTSASPAAPTTRPAGTPTARATSAPSSTRAGPAQPRPLALSHRRLRPPRAARPAPGGRPAPAHRPVGRVLRRRERLRDGAAERRRHLPRRPRPELDATSSSPATACCAATSLPRRAAAPSRAPRHRPGELASGLRLGERAPAGRPYLVLNMVSTPRRQGHDRLAHQGPLDRARPPALPPPAHPGRRRDGRRRHGARSSATGAWPSRTSCATSASARGSRRDPLAVVVSGRLDLPADLPLLNEPEQRVVIATGSDAEPARTSASRWSTRASATTCRS